MLRNIETSEYRYFYAHENNTLFDKSILLCTKADLTTIQNKVNEQDIIEICTQERQNTKWRFKLITNVTIFAALLKNVPMGCPDSVIPEPLLRNNHVNCLISNQDTKQPYNDNLCLFRALAVHLHGTTGLETSTSKIFNDFLEKSGCDPKQFRELKSEELKPTETITWIGKHEPISVSISSNLLDKPIFLCDKDPQSLIIDFVANLKLLAEKNKTEMQSKFLEIEQRCCSYP